MCRQRFVVAIDFAFQRFGYLLRESQLYIVDVCISTEQTAKIRPSLTLKSAALSKGEFRWTCKLNLVGICIRRNHSIAYSG